MNKEAFKPFPVGTVRGPYICGKGNDPDGGVQYCVQTPKGWVYFIEDRANESKARFDAMQFAKNAKDLELVNTAWDLAKQTGFSKPLLTN